MKEDPLTLNNWTKSFIKASNLYEKSKIKIDNQKEHILTDSNK